MLCIFSIIFQIKAEIFTQTVNITKYGERIDMKKYAACHLYDYENETSTIIVKIGEDHEFLNINDIQIGINHIYLPPEPGGIDKFLIQWITGERTSRKPSSEREKQLICRKEETDCDIQVNFSGKKVLKIRGITRRFCKDSYITIGKRPGEDYNRALTPNGEIETSKEEKEFFSMGLIIGISSSFACSLILAAVVAFYIQQKKKKLKEQEENIWRSEEDANHRVEHIYEEIDDSLIGQNPSYHVYDTLGYAKTGRLKSNGYDTLQL